MKNLLIMITVLLTSFTLYSHEHGEDHLWSTDIKAFEYTNTQLKLKKKSKAVLKDSVLINVDHFLLKS